MMIDLPSKPSFMNKPHHLRSRDVSFAGHGFVQGISTYVFPSPRGSTKKIEYDISGSDADKRVAISILNKLSRRSSRDHTSIICDAGNEIAAGICAHGFVDYELVDSHEGPYLYQIDKHSCARVFGVYFSLPDLRSPDHQKNPLEAKVRTEFRVATGRRFWHIRVPNELGGCTKHRRLLRDLSNIGSYMPMFKIEMLHNSRYDYTDRNFDHDLYSKSYAEFISSSTKLWGWSAENSYSKYCTEYYALKRWITSTRSRAILREHIIDALNLFLTYAGISVVFSMKTGRTVEECNEIAQRAEAGDISTAELLGWLSGR